MGTSTVQYSTVLYSTVAILRRHNLDNISLAAVLGGEAALWTEQTSDGNVLTKVKLAVVDYIRDYNLLMEKLRSLNPPLEPSKIY